MAINIMVTKVMGKKKGPKSWTNYVNSVPQNATIYLQIKLFYVDVYNLCFSYQSKIIKIMLGKGIFPFYLNHCDEKNGLKMIWNGLKWCWMEKKGKKMMLNGLTLRISIWYKWLRFKDIV